MTGTKNHRSRPLLSCLTESVSAIRQSNSLPRSAQQVTDISRDLDLFLQGLLTEKGRRKLQRQNAGNGKLASRRKL